jgi:Kelch motif
MEDASQFGITFKNNNIYIVQLPTETIVLKCKILTDRILEGDSITIQDRIYYYYKQLYSANIKGNTCTFSCMSEAETIKHGLSLATDGRHIYCIGGYTGTKVLCSCTRFDTQSTPPIEDYPLPDLIENRSCCGTFIHSSYIYAVGGWDGESRWSNTIERMSIKCLNEWAYVHVNGMLPGFSSISCIAHNNVVYIFGGYNGKESLDSIYALTLDQSGFTSKLMDKSLSQKGDFYQTSSPCIYNDTVYLFGFSSTLHIIPLNNLENIRCFDFSNT